MMAQDRDVLAYGVLEQTAVESDEDRCIEEFLCNGATVLPGVFSAGDMATTGRLMDALYETQREESGGDATLARMGDRDILRCPLAYDDHFLRLATEPSIHSIIARLLGNAYVLMMQNAILNRADREQQQTLWHRDLNYQHWTSSRPLALNFLVAVDRFFVEGGATWVLHGSQAYEKFPSPAFTEKYQRCIEATPGSVVLMNAMTYHRAGRNVTPGYVRRAVNHVVGVPFMAQQIDMPAMLAARGKDWSGDGFLAGYLGYRWNPAADAESWRRKHAK